MPARGAQALATCCPLRFACCPNFSASPLRGKTSKAICEVVSSTVWKVLFKEVLSVTGLSAQCKQY